MASATWECPSCHRRVPRRVDACHCGYTQSQAAALAATPAPPPPGTRQPLPWEIRIGLAFLALVAILGVARLFQRWQPEPIAPVLGYVDQRPPQPPSKDAKKPGKPAGAPQR